jgi:exodeoxyribonuclease V gamma subunit
MLADEAGRRRSPDEWAELLLQAATAMFDVPRTEEWQLAALHGAFGEFVERSSTDGAPSTVQLSLTDVRRALDEHLGATDRRSDFFRGGITITSMTPLRWVPFRVVCLLGMDQHAFASSGIDADDLTTSDPRPGDRDARAEGRQALLETVLSATERLVVVRDGHDVRTNHEVPPAVVLAELHDLLSATVHPDDRPLLEETLEVHHPRQPFDERCFTAGTLGVPGAWGFDPVAHDGALQRRTRDHIRRPFLSEPLAARDPSVVIELADLHAFLRDPVAAFLQQRLGVRLPRREDGLSSLLPVDLDGLAAWAIGDRLLAALSNGASP